MRSNVCFLLFLLLCWLSCVRWLALKSGLWPSQLMDTRKISRLNENDRDRSLVFILIVGRWFLSKREKEDIRSSTKKKRMKISARSSFFFLILEKESFSFIWHLIVWAFVFIHYVPKQMSYDEREDHWWALKCSSADAINGASGDEWINGHHLLLFFIL